MSVWALKWRWKEGTWAPSFKRELDLVSWFGCASELAGGERVLELAADVQLVVRSLYTPHAAHVEPVYDYISCLLCL